MTVRKMTVVSLAGVGLALAGCASGHGGGTPGASGLSGAAGASAGRTAPASGGATASGAAAGAGADSGASATTVSATTVSAATGSAATAVATATASPVPPRRARPLWLDSVRMVSASSGWALGSSQDPADTGAAELLARTSDGGRTWADVTPAAARAMLATEFASAMLATEFASAVLDVTDAAHAYLAVSADTQDAPAVQDPTTVFATADGGRSWTESAPFTVPGGTLVQVTFADAAHGWLLADTGNDGAGHPLPWLYRTTDGRHWAPAVSAAPPGSGGPNNMCQKLGLVFPTATAGWLHVGCRSGEFLVHSTDGGRSWRPQPLPGASACAPVTPCTLFGPQLSSGTAFVTVAPMTTAPTPSLLASSDLGQAWQQIALPSGAGQYPQVSFFTPADGMLVAMGSQQALGAVFFTTDNGGRSWSPVPQGRHFTQLGATVDFADARDGVAWTQAGDAQGATPPPLFTTTDSGRTWTSFAPQLTG